MTDLYLGRDDNKSPVSLPSSHLTTHGLILGMTGSGKTGLGIVMLEELRRANIPLLVLDPKGDMTNLALTFPHLSAEEFRPWCPTGQAEEIASRWSQGLAQHDLSQKDVQALHDLGNLTIYTPGSNAGKPLSLLGTLAPPDNFAQAIEESRDEVSSFVSGLLGLVDIDADPLSSPEHILLANLIEHAWKQGQALTLEQLLSQIIAPPFRKLGVMALETFYPKDDRQKLALRLNGLMAAPGFETWLSGEPLDIQSLLWTKENKARTSIIYLAHLSETERQLVVATVLGKMTTWMRSQSGSERLRAAVYMDEIYGFAPPTAQPPAKAPILTILKQARAYGVGMVLATQNPVDVDYKAMSNTGLWMIGRLQTERDKARVLEGLSSASGNVDVSSLGKLIAGLDKRQFLCHNVRWPQPQALRSRWAMSYLAGPLSKSQLRDVQPQDEPAAPNPETTTSMPQPVSSPTSQAEGSQGAAAVQPANDQVSQEPEIADGRRGGFLAPSCPWTDRLSDQPGSATYQLGIAVRVSIRFDDRKADLNHREEWEQIYFPVGDHFDPDSGIAVDFDDRDFVAERQADGFVLPSIKIENKSTFNDIERDLKQALQAKEVRTIYKNDELSLYSRIGETQADFERRCDAVAQDKADEEVEKLRTQAEAKLRTLARRLDSADARVNEAVAQYEASKTSEVVSGAGSILGVLLGGKMNSRAIAKRTAGKLGGAASRRSRTERTKARIAKAQDRSQSIEDDIADLETRLEDDILDINDKWQEAVSRIEPLEIGLERDDVSIEKTMAIWIPV